MINTSKKYTVLKPIVYCVWFKDMIFIAQKGLQH